MKRSTVTPSSPLAAHAALPAGVRPLVWGPPWPSVDARLVISGVPGVWAFYGAVEYGKQRAIELVAYRDRKRGQLWAGQATRVVAPVEWVYVAGEAEASA